MCWHKWRYYNMVLDQCRYCEKCDKHQRKAIIFWVTIKKK